MSGSTVVKSILVTGSNGFIGSHLCAELLRQGHVVTAVARPNANLVRFHALGLRDFSNFKVRFADFNENEAFDTILQEAQPEIVFHLASEGIRTTHAVNESTLATNVLGTYRLLAASKKFNCQRVLLMGSGFEYANSSSLQSEDSPLGAFTFYGATKSAALPIAKYFAENTPLEVLTARLFTTFGPLENLRRLFPLAIHTCEENLQMDMSSGLQWRDYLYIDDVISGLITLAQAPAEKVSGKAINLCSAQPVKVREIVETIAFEYALATNQTSNDFMAKFNFGAKKDRDGEPLFLAGDNSYLRSLGWSQKYDLRAGIKETLRWYLRQRMDRPELLAAEGLP